MHEWNVIVSASDQGLTPLIEVLGAYGSVYRTEYFHILSMKVENPRQFISLFHEQVRSDLSLLQSIRRIVPVTYTFSFQSPTDYEQKAKEVISTWFSDLVNHSFRVWMHRLGVRGKILSQVEENVFSHYILDKMSNENQTTTFQSEDPDIVIAVETLGQRAGFSMWNRNDLQKWGYLLKLK